MDNSDIDNIPAPSDPNAASDFDALRAVVLLHVGLSYLRPQPLQHRELQALIEAHGAAAASQEELLLERTPPQTPVGRDIRGRDLRNAEEGRAAYRSSLRRS